MLSVVVLIGDTSRKTTLWANETRIRESSKRPHHETGLLYKNGFEDRVKQIANLSARIYRT